MTSHKNTNSKASKFWDKASNKYSKQAISDVPSYEKKLEVSRRYLSAQSRVFEFGCGTGSTALIHAPYVEHIHAIDFSENMIDIAKSKADKEKITNVRFEKASIDNFVAAPESYDAVLGLSVLHLLDDREAAIAKSFELVKPGGVFITSSACLREGYYILLWPLLWLGKLFGQVPTVKFVSVRSLVNSLVAAGFEIDYQWRPAKALWVFIVAKKNK
ncbi:class I SAM-dependent methyltransferase [Arenicella xantha]|uniref:Methyltransferase family protein n=1 Tax=Arenicella xantha TaxID=644221 RepID=A0A395JIU7_9GAMM|nr:class I SAM-dependent methyltransferase [Arenicella xantha]RBP50601.1 methyltransferase family protein [Arenicella xantha]